MLATVVFGVVLGLIIYHYIGVVLALIGRVLYWIGRFITRPFRFVYNNIDIVLMVIGGILYGVLYCIIRPFMLLLGTTKDGIGGGYDAKDIEKKNKNKVSNIQVSTIKKYNSFSKNSNDYTSKNGNYSNETVIPLENKMKKQFDNSKYGYIISDEDYERLIKIYKK